MASDQPTFGSSADRPEFVPGEIIVRFHQGAVRPHIAGGEVRLDAEMLRRLPAGVTEPIDFLRRAAGARHIEPVFSERGLRLASRRLPVRDQHLFAVAASVADAPEHLAGINVVKLASARVTPKLLKLIEESPSIEFAERAPARWLLANTADPLQNKQWGLRSIRWFQAKRPDASEIRVAVIDSGVDVSHPELTGADIRYDHLNTTAKDVLGHGTHVAGIIAATINNGVGISGVANCKLSVWKVTPDEPTKGSFPIDTTRFLRALRAVSQTDARVVNLSLGGIRQAQAEQLVIDGLELAGITLVAAIGNDFERGNPLDYPGAYSGVLAVGAVGEDDLRARYSTTGAHNVLVAPGSNVLSTIPTSKSKHRSQTNYTSWSGTSFAAPHVAAAAAILLAKYPHWSPADIRDRLATTARKLPAMKGSDWTSAYGNGLLDLEAALS